MARNTLPNRFIAPGNLIRQILSHPRLIESVQRLPAPALARLIDHVGLEDCGELVSLASASQLVRVLDEDLWRNTAPGQRERFDGKRFGLWLEILLEMGADRAAEKLGEMDEDFLCLALQELLLVIDSEALLLSEGLEVDELGEKALEDSVALELEGFWLIPRSSAHWDAICAILVALDERDHSLLHRLLSRCSRISKDWIEEQGGLQEALTLAEQLQGDVSGEREKRREKSGHVSPETAAAFLKLCAGPESVPDLISQAYFRDFEPETIAVGAAGDSSLLELLHRAGVIEASRSPLLEFDGSGSLQAIRAWLDEAEADPERHARQLLELSFLAQVLLAGAEIEGRRYRPGEAIRAVLCACDRALRAGRRERSAIRLFRAGWLSGSQKS